MHKNKMIYFYRREMLNHGCTNSLPWAHQVTPKLDSIPSSATSMSMIANSKSSLLDTTCCVASELCGSWNLERHNCGPFLAKAKPGSMVPTTFCNQLLTFLQTQILHPSPKSPTTLKHADWDHNSIGLRYSWKVVRGTRLLDAIAFQ